MLVRAIEYYKRKENEVLFRSMPSVRIWYDEGNDKGELTLEEIRELIAKEKVSLQNRQFLFYIFLFLSIAYTYYRLIND